MHTSHRFGSGVVCPTHRSSTCPRKAVSAASNLRHGAAAVSRRVDVSSSSSTPLTHVEEWSQALPVALAVGACSLLLSASAARAAPARPSYAPAFQTGSAHQQQQLSSSPAALTGYRPAAAPSVLTMAPARKVGILQETSPSQHSFLQDTSMQLQGGPQFLQAATQSTQHSMQLSQLPQEHQRVPQELLQLAQFDEPRIHWLLVVLGIGVINVLGLQAVLKVLQASKDSSTPVTVLVARMGLRVNNKSSQLQERLHFLRDMMGVEHAMFFTFEEAMQAICNPPRGCQLAYADLEAFPLSSKQAGYDTFKQKAMIERVRAAREEDDNVQHGPKPDGPNHRNMLQKLLGAAETQDAEEAQACVLVTLVVLSKGTVRLPEQPLRSQQAFKESMKSLCGHLKVGQFLAVELLMTPNNPQDFLSEAQLMTDYSFLTDLSSGLRVDHPNWSPVTSPFASTDDFGGRQFAVEAAAAAMAAMAVDAGGAEGAASAAAAAAALQDGRKMR